MTELGNTAWGSEPWGGASVTEIDYGEPRESSDPFDKWVFTNSATEYPDPFELLLTHGEAALLYFLVLVSLFTDKRATKEEMASGGLDDTDLRGWWADYLISDFGFKNGAKPTGSLLHTLRRAKDTTLTLNYAKSYIKDALDWFLKAEIATEINITAARAAGGAAFSIEVLNKQGGGIRILNIDPWKHWR